MVSGKYSALSGAIAREQSMANTSANLSNVSTVGFKKSRMSFESILRGEQQIQDTKGINYNRVKANYIDFSQGPLQETNNPFDIALTGEGFFKLRGENGELLTRSGNFHLDDAGRLLSQTGYPVLDTGGGEITISDADISKMEIDEEGNIYTIDGDGEATQAAQLAVVDVEDRSVLKNVAGTSFSIPLGTPEIVAENFSISQGFLEQSNVNMTDEMTKMIADSRLFESYHNVLEKFSELNGKLDELGSVS